MKYLLICSILIASGAAHAQNYPEQLILFPGDLSNDSVVGTDDLMLLLSLWGLDYASLFELDVCGGASHLDYRGHQYDIVPIGDQCWFAENLRTEVYANGDSIPGNLDDYQWAITTSGAQAVYGEGTSDCTHGNCDELVNLEVHGRLYNWYAVYDARNICPASWHVPTDEEWMTLEISLGMSESEAQEGGVRGTNEGAKMKSSPSDTPGWNGTNESGFSALPSGMRTHHGIFSDEGYNVQWWSASLNEAGSPCDGGLPWYHYLGYTLDMVGRGSNFELQSGFSVRCVHD